MGEETVKSLLIELVLENGKLKASLDEANAALDKHGKKGKSVFSQLKAGWLATAAAVAAVVAAVAASVKAYIEAEKAQNRLVVSLRNHGNASRETIRALNDQAAALSKVTKFEDDQITMAQGTLAQYGLNRKQIETVTKATMNLAEAKGIELSEAAEMVGKTIGTENNLLSRQAGIVVNASDKNERLAQVVKGLDANFAGMAESAGQTAGGQLKILSNNLGNVQEDLGKAVLYGLKPAISSLNDFFASTKGSEELRSTFRAIMVSAGVMGAFIGGAVKLVIAEFSALVDGVVAFKDILLNIGNKTKFVESCNRFNDAIQRSIIEPFNISKDTILDVAKVVQKTGDEGEKAFEGITSGSKNAEGAARDLTEAEKKVRSALDMAFQTDSDQDQKLIDAEKVLQDEYIRTGKIRKDLAEGIDKLENKIIIARTQAVLDQAEQIATQFTAVIDGIFQNSLAQVENDNQAASEKIDATYEKEKAALDDKLEHGLVSQDAYNAQLKALDEQNAADKEKLDKDTARKTAEIKRKQAQYDKAANIVGAIINTAQGVVKTLSSFGVPLGPILASVIGALGAAQVAVIAAQPLPPVPAFSRGGMIDSVMPSPMSPSGEDGLIAARRGESVLNQQATAILGEDAVNALNAGSQIGGHSFYITIYSNNGQEVVRTINNYMRQYGNKRGGGI